MRLGIIRCDHVHTCEQVSCVILGASDASVYRASRDADLMDQLAMSCDGGVVWSAAQHIDGAAFQVCRRGLVAKKWPG